MEPYKIVKSATKGVYSVVYRRRNRLIGTIYKDEFDDWIAVGDRRPYDTRKLAAHSIWVRRRREFEAVTIDWGKHQPDRRE